MNPQITQTAIEVQPAQTGGISSCSADGPLSRPHFSEEVSVARAAQVRNWSMGLRALPETIAAPQAFTSKRFGGRVVLSRPNGKALYIGPNGGPQCATCGSSTEMPSLEAFDKKPWLRSFCLALARKRFHRGKETPCMSAPREQATKLAKLPDRIAAVLGKTVAVRGDAFELDDAEALVRIMDLLNEYDETIIERNAKKKLARSGRPS